LPAIPKKLIPFDADQKQLHLKVIEMRNELYAHADGHRFEVQPVSFGTTLAISIVTLPSYRIEKGELEKLFLMIVLLLKSFGDRQRELEFHLGFLFETQNSYRGRCV